MITFYVERIMCRVKTVTLRHCSMPSSPDLGDQGNPHQTKNLCFKSFGVRNLQKRLNQKFLGIWWWYNLCPNIWSTTRTQFKCILASQIEPSRIRSLQTNVLKKLISYRNRYSKLNLLAFISARVGARMFKNMPCPSQWALSLLIVPDTPRTPWMVRMIHPSS